MKRILRLLIRLYPAWWRRRYGKELEALLEDSGSRDAWDLFRGAMEIQMKSWSFGRTVTICGIAGVLLAGAAAFLLRPYPYQSTATLKLAPPDTDAFVRTTQAAFTRNALVSIINDYNLYPRERRNMPMEDVIDNVMRREIQVRPVAPDLAQVSFAYEDPIAVQRVSQALIGRLIAANLTTSVVKASEQSAPGARLEVLQSPSRPKKQVAKLGLASLPFPLGLLFGVVLALILRRRAAVAKT